MRGRRDRGTFTRGQPEPGERVRYGGGRRSNRRLDGRQTEPSPYVGLERNTAEYDSYSGLLRDRLVRRGICELYNKTRDGEGEVLTTSLISTLPDPLGMSKFSGDHSLDI